MMWHVVYAEPSQLLQSRAAKSPTMRVERHASYSASPSMFAGALKPPQPTPEHASAYDPGGKALG